MNKTTIQVEKTTLERLKKIKLTKRESYEEILIRLMNFNKQLNEPNQTNVSNKQKI